MSRLTRLVIAGRRHDARLSEGRVAMHKGRGCPATAEDGRSASVAGGHAFACEPRRDRRRTLGAIRSWRTAARPGVRGSLRRISGATGTRLRWPDGGVPLVVNQRQLGHASLGGCARCRVAPGYEHLTHPRRGRLLCCSRPWLG